MMNKLRLENKVAVVTGVASGMGRAIAEMFAEEGAKVVGCDYDVYSGQNTIDAIAAKGGDAVFVRCNLRVREDIARVRETAIDRYGGISTLVNAAGIVVLGPFHESNG